MIEVGELQRVSQEEHRGVIANHVPVALFGVELDRETTDIALGIRRTPITCNGGETQENIRALV